MQDNLTSSNLGNEDVLAFGNTNMCKVEAFNRIVDSTIREKLADQLVAELDAKGLRGVRIQEDKRVSEGRTDKKPANWKWFSAGKDCEILKIGAKGWQKGKVKIRISLEFCPEEPEDTETPENNQPETNAPESPLDDLRRMINEQTQENNQ